MKLPIGKVIYSLRKEMSVTQEQLASSVGVSVPAVSKWESGQAYPDITMLPSIARYFNTTIDSLLKYEINLSDDEVMELIAKSSAVFENDSLEAGIEMCEHNLYQYPNNLFLKLRTGALYATFLHQAKDEVTLQDLALKATYLLEQAAQSPEMEICHSANYLLGTLYMLLNETEKAEQALARIPKNLVNPEDMLVPLYVRQHRYTDAKKLLQTNMYGRVQHVISALSTFAYISQKEDDPEFGARLLQMQRQIIDLFDLNAVNLLANNLEMTQFYALQKDREKTLKYAEAILSSLQDCSRRTFNQSLHSNRLFDHVELMEPMQSAEYFRQNLTALFTLDDLFDFIRDEPRFQALVERFHTIWSD